MECRKILKNASHYYHAKTAVTGPSPSCGGTATCRGVVRTNGIASCTCNRKMIIESYEYSSDSSCGDFPSHLPTRWLRKVSSMTVQALSDVVSAHSPDVFTTAGVQTDVKQLDDSSREGTYSRFLPVQVPGRGRREGHHVIQSLFKHAGPVFLVLRSTLLRKAEENPEIVQKNRYSIFVCSKSQPTCGTSILVVH